MTAQESAENDRRELKRPLLYLLVGSVLLGAVAGIVIVLRDEWGWFEVRVILTTITIDDPGSPSTPPFRPSNDDPLFPAQAVGC